MLGGIIFKNRVAIGCHELVLIDSNERRASDASIDGIREESFMNTRDDRNHQKEVRLLRRKGW